jgi:hypothetical protein
VVVVGSRGRKRCVIRQAQVATKPVDGGGHDIRLYAPGEMKRRMNREISGLLTSRRNYRIPTEALTGDYHFEQTGFAALFVK